MKPKNNQNTLVKVQKEGEAVQESKQSPQNETEKKIDHMDRELQKTLKLSLQQVNEYNLVDFFKTELLAIHRGDRPTLSKNDFYKLHVDGYIVGRAKSFHITQKTMAYLFMMGIKNPRPLIKQGKR